MSAPTRAAGRRRTQHDRPAGGARSGADCLTSDMVLVHKVFRRELRMLARLIGTVSAGHAERAALLGGHYRELARALIHHHDAERDLLWRRLRDRAQLTGGVETRMSAWHRQHAALMSELDALLPLWEQAADPEIAAALVDIVGELAASVAEHLDAVESDVLPAVARSVSPGEWLAMGLRAASWIPLNRMAWLLGAMLEDATPAERANLMAKVPAPARLLYRMVGREQYAREMQQLRGTAAAAG